MRNLNRTATLAFYNVRRRKGDSRLLSEYTGYSQSHVINMMTGRRKIQQNVADAMFVISQTRVKNV